jgi:recombination protein RecA
MSTNDVLNYIKHKSPKSPIVKLSDPSIISHVTEFVSTGCPPLDLIMCGGAPVGRLMEIYGDTSTGKTAVGAHILAETQKMGGIGVLLDTETAIDTDMMEIMGVDPDALIYSIPETVEEVYDDLSDIIDAKREVDPDGLMTIVWDSVAATSADEEIEKVRRDGLGKGVSPAIHARLISQLCRVMKKEIAKDNIAFVILNQTRAKIGVLYGDKKATFGGRAIGYYSAVRLELAIAGKIKEKNVPIGINVRAYVAKSKVGPPFGKVVFPILFDSGIDEAGAVLNWLKDEKIAVVHGAWTNLTLLNGEELRFQRPTWADLYNDNRDEVLSLMYEIEGE